MKWLASPLAKNILRSVLLVGLVSLSLMPDTPLWLVALLVALVVALWFLSAYEDFARRP